MSHTVIIADDSALHLHILSLYIEELGYTCLGKTDNGIEAVELAQRLNPDIVVLDINMPIMGGDLACKIIQTQLRIPCLLITGHANIDIREYINDTRPSGVVIKPINIIQLKSAIELALEKEKEYKSLSIYKAIIHNTPMLFALVDKEYRYILVNSYYCLCFKKTESEIVGRSIADIFGTKTFQASIKKYIDCALHGETARFQSWFDFSGVGRRFMSFTYLPYSRETKDLTEGVLIISADHTQLKLSEEKLEVLSSTDPLTNTTNRRKFLDCLDLEIERSARRKASFAFLLADIDNFKSVNDTYGHTLGDEALAYVAQTLKTSIRKIDTLGRLGGEEFGLIITETNALYLQNVLSRIICRFNANTFRKDDVALRITVSIGVALYPGHAQTKDGLLDLADQAMYAAKHSGKNTFCVYDNDAFSFCMLR